MAKPIGGRSSLPPLPLLILLLLFVAAIPTSATQQTPPPAPASAQAPAPIPLPPSPEQDPVPARPVSPGGGGDGNTNAGKGYSGGMSAGKKVGIAFGVIVSAGVVGFGGFVYKKRRANIRRSRYAYAAQLHQL